VSVTHTAHYLEKESRNIFQGELRGALCITIPGEKGRPKCFYIHIGFTERGDKGRGVKSHSDRMRQLWREDLILSLNYAQPEWNTGEARRFRCPNKLLHSRIGGRGKESVEGGLRTRSCWLKS